VNATSTPKKEFRCHYDLVMAAMEMKRGALEIKRAARGQLVAVADVLQESTHAVLVSFASEAIVALLVLRSGGLRAEDIGEKLQLPADCLREALDRAISSGRVAPRGGKRTPVYVWTRSAGPIR